MICPDRMGVFLQEVKWPDEGEAIEIVVHIRTNQLLLHRLLPIELSTALRICQPHDVLYQLTDVHSPRLQHRLLADDPSTHSREDGVRVAAAEE